MSKVTTAIETLSAEYSEEKVRDMVDHSMSDYLSDGWEDEFDDEYEAYCEQGGGAAEMDVMQGIVDGYAKDNGITLTSEEWCEIHDTLKDKWGLTW